MSQQYASADAEMRARKDKVRLRLMRDFPYYAENVLKIRTKRAEVKPFKLNSSQRLLHEQIEDQLARTGMVRKIVLKGRQVGISTYLDGRAYWKTTHGRGLRALILAHEEVASSNLFEMANRFHDHCPPEFKPSTGAANAKELVFDRLDSGFKVATAGNKAVGRSSTIQIFHGSECGFWPNAIEHMAGVVQAIANVEGSEAYLESTANGIGNVFHTLWKQAERGEVDWEPVFIPWFLHEEYRRPLPPAGFEPPEEWAEYGDIFDLDIEQLFWAYRKNGELLTEIGSNADTEKISPKFLQEYPGTSAQAFETSGANAFISPQKVLKARKNKVAGYGPIILGVDPARGGKDKTGIIDRQGRRMGAHVCERINFGENTMAVASAIKRHVIRLLPHGLKKVCIDTTGLGGPIYDRLTEIIPDAENLLEAVNFASSAHDEKRYLNRRSEMWDQKRQWYNDPAGVQVPDDDAFQGDECAPIEAPGATHFRSNGQLVLEPKEKIKARIGLSPDIGDAAALTFAPDMTLLFSKKRREGRGRDDDGDGGSSWAA